MKLLILSTLALVLGSTTVQGADDPTLYEYYHSGGIKSGLEANSDQFTLNGKHFVIYSGSFHYFRVVPQNWAPILARFKAAGLNSVQLYLSWNLHEDIPDHFDFESAQLNLAKFLEDIKAADMFAVVRPGPYICAEWEMGGYPSWLLRDPNMSLRSMYQPHLDRVKLYMDKVLAIINKYQFTEGGPVIMLQLENEYSWVMQQFKGVHGAEYYQWLRDLVVKSGFKQLLFASDPPDLADWYPIREVFPDGKVLETMNMNTDSMKHIEQLKKSQPNKPVYVSEFWPGWLDTWHEKEHHKYTVEKFDSEVSDVLFKLNSSINFYMFIGGTNFGFMNGGRVITSYDYDAPLSEAGNYTAKYHKTRELYLKLVASGRFPKVHLPDVPPAPLAHAYGKVPLQEMLPLEEALKHALSFPLVKPVPMEYLNLSASATYGQRFGFILYRVEVPEAKTDYEVTGQIKDRAIFLVDGNNQGGVYDGADNFTQAFKSPLAPKTSGFYKLDLLIENLGRSAGGPADLNVARSGILDGEIKVDGKVQSNITAFSLDFQPSFLAKLATLKEEWAAYNQATWTNPTLFRASLDITGTPQDTYLSMADGWDKGSVFVNGFNVGRYWKVGPAHSLYIPAPILKTGKNEIVVFEQYKASSELVFLDHPILE